MKTIIALLTFSFMLMIHRADAASFEKTLMPGDVIAAHAKIEEDCAQCHQKFDKAAQDKLCLACHKEVASDITSQKGFHGRLDSSTCRRCHTEHKGREKNIVPFEQNTFAHHRTDFELNGKHQSLICKDCHLPGKKWRDAPQHCNDCHRDDDPHKGSLGKQCQQCHGSDNWQQAQFDHSKTTLPLTEAHAKTACTQCHVNKQWKLPASTCVSCHKKDDVHRNGFGEQCANCHSSTAFKPALSFDHETKTLFKLLGAHQNTSCKACHAVGVAAHGLGRSCISCHKNDDVHAGKLGNRCEACHSEQRWQQSSFNHDSTTFHLRNRHAQIKCGACHANNRFAQTPTQCLACHQKEDKHKGALGNQCQTCHDDSRWKSTHFDHSKDTRWPLRGAHAKPACQACHTPTTVQQKPPTQCIACHQKNDVHNGKLGRQCETCHGVTSFKTDIRFDHSNSAFPLRGAHAHTRCNACHDNALFKGTPQTCHSCHQKDDVHKGSFGAQCAQCHNERHFMLWSFDHKKTGFDLIGAHNTVSCHQCHVPGSTKTSNLCASCHQKDDPHDGQFGARCNSCHSLYKWLPVHPRKP